jgi:hypothetical protein
MSDPTLIPSNYANVTPSDTTPVSASLGLYIGVSGSVVVMGANGVQATFQALAGQYLSGKFYKVMAATTASSIVALYA